MSMTIVYYVVDDVVVHDADDYDDDSDDTWYTKTYVVANNCKDDGPVNCDVGFEYQHREGKMKIMRFVVCHSTIYWRIRRWYDDVEEGDNHDVNYAQGVGDGFSSDCGDTKMVFVGVMMLGIYGVALITTMSNMDLMMIYCCYSNTD